MKTLENPTSARKGNARGKKLSPAGNRIRRMKVEMPDFTDGGRIRPPARGLYVMQPGSNGEQGPELQNGKGNSIFGHHADFRLILSMLSAHEAAVGSMKVRNGGKLLTGKEFAKNELSSFIDTVIKGYDERAGTSPEGLAWKATSDLYAAALEAKRGSAVGSKAVLQLNELRKTTINNYVRARSHFLEMYFHEEVLGQNDSAYIRNESQYPMAVYYMGQDGKPRMQRAIPSYNNYLIPLYYVASDKFGYQIEDLQRGNITAPAMRSVDIAYDVAAQLDYYAYLLLTGSLSRASTNGGVNGVFGAFTTVLTTPSYMPNSQQLYTFYPSNRVQQTLLPTTNVLTPRPDPVPAGLSQGSKGAGYLIDPGGNPVIGLNVPHAAINYADSFGNIWPDGPLRPTGLILTPAVDAASVLAQVTPTAAKPSAIAEGLLSNYTRVEYGGYVWTFMPDVTIPRGTVFFVFNKPVGINFVKPSFDREFVNTDFENNWEDRWYRKTQGMYVPVQWTPRAATCTYS